MPKQDRRDTVEYRLLFVAALNKACKDYGMVISTCVNGCGMAIISNDEESVRGAELLLMEDEHHVYLQRKQ